MLSVLVFLPLVVSIALVAVRALPPRAVQLAFVATTLVEVALAAALWWRYDSPSPGELAFDARVDWIPGVGSSYHVGLDGISLPLVVMTTLVFAACAVYVLGEEDRPRAQAALFLFLECVSLGLFAAADLLVFFVFFDLSIVAMYFVIAGWGHGDAARSALKFFLYTFLGSLALLLGFIGLYIGADPHTFDMVELAGSPPFQDRGVAGGLVLAAIVLGLAVKTPTFPFHTWLPPAHTDAPAIGSAVLAAVLLKMGAYGFVRIAMPMLPEAWRAWAIVIIVVGVVSVLWGALAALAQDNLKRMVAYTSVNHMGYVVLAVGAAGLAADQQAREVAVTGAVTQMVSHGLLTGGLFLLAGVMARRTESYDMGRYGGLAQLAPRFAALFAVAAFGSLGLPALSGFIAEFQIFAGSIAAAPATAVATVGIVLTAALFLRALQRVFSGPEGELTAGFADLTAREWVPVSGLLAVSVAIGIWPRPLLDLIEPAAAAVVALVGR